MNTEPADYEDLRDDELVAMAQAGDELADEELYLRYKNIVCIKARSYFILGADRDDILQEGMIGLFKAIRDYRPDRQAAFKTFAEMCIVRQMITAIQNATRMKHIPLNNYISLSRPVGNEEYERTMMDVIPSHARDNPEDMLIVRESVDSMIRKIKERLTELEYKTLTLFIDGKSYQEIADMLGCNKKTIDNALQRVKRKMEKFLEEANSQDD